VIERAWWPRAALRRDEDDERERRVTWLELFFDLVFVVVISRLAHGLAGHVDLRGVVDFGLMFAAVFWAWNAFTFYVERFESGGLEHRAFVFAAIATSAAMAVWVDGGLGRHYTGFVIAYIATRSVNMVQWIRAGVHVPVFRPVAVRFVAGFAVTAAVLLVGLSVAGDARRAVFAIAVLIDIATPTFTLGHQAKLPQISTSKFPERFGQLTMVVLGESVVGVISSVSDRNEHGLLDVRSAINAGLGLGIGFGLWWIYFDFVARRPPKPSLPATLGWVYLHLATLAAITATGTGISVAIADDGARSLSAPARSLLAGSAAVALIGFGALELTLRRAAGEPTHPTVSPGLKVVSGAIVVLVATVDLGWSTMALLAVILIALAVPAAYGAAVWFAPTNTHRTEQQEIAP